MIIARATDPPGVAPTTPPVSATATTRASGACIEVSPGQVSPKVIYLADSGGGSQGSRTDNHDDAVSVNFEVKRLIHFFYYYAAYVAFFSVTLMVKPTQSSSCYSSKNRVPIEIVGTATIGDCTQLTLNTDVLL